MPGGKYWRDCTLPSADAYFRKPKPVMVYLPGCDRPYGATAEEHEAAATHGEYPIGTRIVIDGQEIVVTEGVSP